MRSLKIVALLAVAACGCATLGPPPKCNPVMVQCNPGDYPPLSAQLPPWPFPSLMRPIPEAVK